MESHLLILLVIVGSVPLIFNIIMANMQAYRQEVLYPRYLFLFYGWYNDQWWIGSKHENLSCTVEQRERVIRSGLAILQDELISNCLKYAETGIVSFCSQTYIAP